MKSIVLACLCFGILSSRLVAAQNGGARRMSASEAGRRASRARSQRRYEEASRYRSEQAVALLGAGNEDARLSARHSTHRSAVIDHLRAARSVERSGELEWVEPHRVAAIAHQRALSAVDPAEARILSLRAHRATLAANGALPEDELAPEALKARLRSGIRAFARSPNAAALITWMLFDPEGAHTFASAAFPAGDDVRRRYRPLHSEVEFSRAEVIDLLTRTLRNSRLSEDGKAEAAAQLILFGVDVNGEFARPSTR